MLYAKNNKAQSTMVYLQNHYGNLVWKTGNLSKYCMNSVFVCCLHIIHEQNSTAYNNRLLTTYNLHLTKKDKKTQCQMEHIQIDQVFQCLLLFP